MVAEGRPTAISYVVEQLFTGLHAYSIPEGQASSTLEMLSEHNIRIFETPDLGIRIVFILLPGIWFLVFLRLTKPTSFFRLYLRLGSRSDVLLARVSSP